MKAGVDLTAAVGGQVVGPEDRENKSAWIRCAFVFSIF